MTSGAGENGKCLARTVAGDELARCTAYPRCICGGPEGWPDASVKPRTFVFNFQRQFADDVASGRKLQTVRATRKDNKVPRRGETVKLYTGLRTRAARLLGTSVVVDCFPVHMDLAEPPTIVSNGIRLHHGEANSFARLDGFENAAAMFAWFREAHGEEFEGFCVCWRSPTA